MRAGLREWAERAPGRPALLIDGQTALDYAVLEARANRIAHAIGAAGLTRGDHIAMLMGNTADAVALCWGAYRSGVYLTPVHTALTATETAYIINNCQARLVAVDARFGGVAEQLPALCPAATFRALGGEIPRIMPWEPELTCQPETPRADENPGSLMMYSSGTTGAPKGIMRPLPDPDQAHLLPPFARDLVELFHLGEHTRYLSTAPLYHAAALRFALAVIAGGGFALVMPKFDAARSLQLIDAHGLNVSQWVPTMFRRLLDLPPAVRGTYSGATHTHAIHGAAPCKPSLKRAMIDWWGPILQEYYSGSEGVGLTMIDSHEWLQRPGSAGRARKGILHILGENDEELGPGEVGRVFFSGLPRFEYFGEPEKTASKTSSQGWQTFGDIGRVDTDGYLYLTDRADDMIISGGVNVYPQEIEAAIEEADFVAECGVVGMPDPEFDERPVAFVVPVAGEENIAERLERHIRTRLGRVKRPRELHVVQSLPLSPTGKLLRRELRRLLP